MIKQILYFGNPCSIKKENQQLIITIKRNDKEEVISRPIEDIGVVILDHPQINLTHGAISELMQKNVALICCNNQYMPNGMMLPFDAYHTQTQRMHAQIKASQALKRNLWQQTIISKITNQAKVLEYTQHSNHPLYNYAKNVKSGDTSNREAAAANYYWAHLFPSIPNFNRDSNGQYPNNLLNYGYAILRSIMARSIVAAGLFPSIGVYHHNKYNAYCLADDLMEPYRPYVDKLILQIIKKYPDKKELNTELKKELLTIPHLDVTIDKEKSVLMIASQRTASSLARCFTGETRKILYPNNGNVV